MSKTTWLLILLAIAAVALALVQLYGPKKRIVKLFTYPYEFEA